MTTASRTPRPFTSDIMKWINKGLEIGRTIWINIAAFEPFDGPDAKCGFCHTTVCIDLNYWHWVGERVKYTHCDECHRTISDCEVLCGRVVHHFPDETYPGIEVFSSSDPRK